MKVIGYLLLLISVNIFAAKLGIAHGHKDHNAVKNLLINAGAYILGILTATFYYL